MDYPEVQLPEAINLQPKVDAQSFKVLEVIDNPENQSVVARVRIGTAGINFFEVWKGQSYLDIGQWTEAQLTSALIPMIEAAYPPAAV